MSYVEIVTAAVRRALSVYFYIVRSTDGRGLWDWSSRFVHRRIRTAKLYADMLLHFYVYTGLQLYGWWAWYQSSKRLAASPVGLSPGQDDSLEIRELGMKGNVICIVVSLAMTTVYAFLLARFTDASSPLPDSCIAAFSLTAQMLLAWRLHRQLAAPPGSSSIWLRSACSLSKNFTSLRYSTHSFWSWPLLAIEPGESK